MSTYDDFDGACFTIQSMRLTQADVLSDLSFFILDNHPEGVVAPALRKLADNVPEVRYLPFRGYRSTAARDLVFREADADIVLCVDSHVLLRPGALRGLLEYFDANPESLDIVQGPLLDESLQTVVGTHFKPGWGAGMYGQWATDERIKDPECEPFEIGMQGLGVFACRKAAWPGINPRFRGFGGEEGYLHEKFRQQGGRAVCLPALAWWHRFDRPGRIPYPSNWEDRIRNYYIGWAEIGWDTTPMEEHFRGHLQAAEAEAVIASATKRVNDPLMFFDAICYLDTDNGGARWTQMEERCTLLDIGWRVERFPSPENVGPRRKRCVPFRAVIEAARSRDFRNVLIIESGSSSIKQSLDGLPELIRQLEEGSWDIQQMPGGAAMAIASTAYDRLLADLPAADDHQMETFLSAYGDLGGYLHHGIADGTYKCPVVPTPLISPAVHLDKETAVQSADPAQSFPLTPAWVVDLLYRTLQVVDLMLNDLGIPYSLMAGSLLGAVRHGGLIPWDDDGDLAIRVQDMPMLCAHVEQFLGDRGFGFHGGGNNVLKVFPLSGRITGYRFYYPFVDIFPMSQVNGRWVYSSLHEREASLREYFELQTFEGSRRCAFGPLQLSAMPESGVDRYLSSLYGPKWASEASFQGFHQRIYAIERYSAPGRFEPALPSVDAFDRVIVEHEHARSCPVHGFEIERNEVADGLVIHQGRPARTHHLNNTAALVFELSTGSTSIEEMAGMMQEMFGLETSPLAEVASSVEELRAQGILQ
jgi:hypothetical protein